MDFVKTMTSLLKGNLALMGINRQAHNPEYMPRFSKASWRTENNPDSPLVWTFQPGLRRAPGHPRGTSGGHGERSGHRGGQAEGKQAGPAQEAPLRALHQPNREAVTLGYSLDYTR